MKGTYSHTERRSRVVARHKVQRASGNHTHTHIETARTRQWIETAEGVLEIDLDALARQLASRAIRSKSGRSAMASGKIKFRITKRTEAEVVEVDHRPSEGYVVVEEIAA